MIQYDYKEEKGNYLVFVTNKHYNYITIILIYHEKKDLRMTSNKNLINFGLLGLFLAISIVSVQQIYATGCPITFVSEHITNAKTALESGNTEEVLNQLQLAEEAIGMAAQEGNGTTISE